MNDQKNSASAFITLPTAHQSDVVQLPQEFKLLSHAHALNLPTAPTICIPHQSFLELIATSNLVSLWHRVQASPPQQKAHALVNFTQSFKKIPLPSSWFDRFNHVYTSYLQDNWVTIFCPGSPALPTRLLPKSTPFMRGESVIAKTIHNAWTLLLNDVTAAINTNPYAHPDIILPSIIIQSVPSPECSGQIDSIKSNNHKYYAITAFRGLSPQKQSLAVSVPDHYTLDFLNGELVSSQIPPKFTYTTLDRYGRVSVKKINSKRPPTPLIDSKLLHILLKHAKKLESALQHPLSLDFYISHGRLFISGVSLINSSPVTPSQSTSSNYTSQINIKAPAIAQGIPASPGQVSGVLKVINTPKDLGHLSGSEIVYLPSASITYVPYIHQVAGLIAKTGGLTSHLAVVARETGLPLITSVNHLPAKSGDSIFIDGTSGKIYPGSNQAIPMLQTYSQPDHLYTLATRIFLNTTQANLHSSLETITHLAGVGQLRARHILSAFGKHPKSFTRADYSQFEQLLHTTVFNICQNFANKPVYYVPVDLNALDYDELLKGSNSTPVDTNPLLGYRGVSRLLNDPMLLDLELKVIFHLRSHYNCTNLHLVAPFVRSSQEFLQFKRRVHKSNPVVHSTLQTLSLIETPAMANAIPSLIESGADGFILSLDHLIPLYLGIDPLSHELQNLIQPMITQSLPMLTNAIGQAAAANKLLILSGALLAHHLDLLPPLVQAGLSAVSTEISYLHTLNAALHHAHKRQFN